MNHNVVILLDLNCFPVEDEPSKDSFMKWIHHYLLTMFAKVATTESDGSTNYSKIKWSYKLFNSAKEKNYPSKALHQFNYTSFEAFESSSKTEFEKYLPESLESISLNKCSCLSKALKDIMADCGMPDTTKTEEKTLNSVYAFLRVPRNEEELGDFLDSQDDFEGSPNPNSRMLLNALLPPAFLKQFRKLGIQLNMIDMCVLHKESNLETEWDGKTYSKQIVKVMDYLNKGKVIQFEKPEEVAMPMGLPSYFQLLKQALKGIDTDLSAAAHKMHKKVTQSKADSSTTEKPRVRNEDSFNTSFASSNSRMKSIKSRGDEQRSGSYRRMPYGGHDGMSDLLPDTQSGTDDSSVSESYPMDVFSKRGERELTRQMTQARASSSRRTQIFKEPARRLYPRDRLYASADQPTKRPKPKPVNPEITSRTAQLRSLAVAKENRKWRVALEKEEQERNALRMERLEVSVKSETALALMRAKLEVFFERAGVSPLDCTLEETVAAVREYEEFYVSDESKCVLAVGQAAVQVVVEKVKNTRFKKMKIEEECNAKQLLVESTSEQQRLKDFYAAKKQEGKEVRVREMHGRAELMYTETNYEEKENERKLVEQTLFVPITDLRAKIRECKNDEKKFKEVFRLCQYQIVVRMETSFLLPVTADVTDDLRDEMVDLLNLLSIHVKKEVDDFVNNILLQGYLETHSEMLVRLFRGLSLDPPRQLMLVCTPSKSLRSRCSFRAGSSIASPFGSMESLLFAAPYLSSQSKTKVPVKMEPMSRLPTESSLGGKSSNRTLARHKSHLSVNNPKKMMLVSVRNVKKFGVTTMKPKSPKPPSGGRSRVRRNLMADLRSPAKPLRSAERPIRSPSVTGRGNVFLMRNLRSKRKLEWEEDDDQPRKICRLGSSPEMFSPEGGENAILCPGTPSDRSVHSAKMMKKSPYGMSPGNYLIAASPECQKGGEVPKRLSDGFQSTSFYSNGTDSLKSRIWDHSGNAMMTAKVKRDLESSSFMKTGLTIHDLEIIGGLASSPESNKASSVRRTAESESSKHKISSTGRNVVENVEVVKSNASPCIAALIRSNQSIATLKTTPKCEPPVTATPTKKITFNFNNEIPRTPKSNSSPGTPKSILKTPSRYESADSYTPRRNVRKNGAVRELAEHFSPTRDDDVGKRSSDCIAADIPAVQFPMDLSQEVDLPESPSLTLKLSQQVAPTPTINTEPGLAENEGGDSRPVALDYCVKNATTESRTQTQALNENINEVLAVDSRGFTMGTGKPETVVSSTDETLAFDPNMTSANAAVPVSVTYCMPPQNATFGYPSHQTTSNYFYETFPYPYGLVYDVASQLQPPTPLSGYVPVPATYVSSPVMSMYQQAPGVPEASYSGLANLTTCEPSTLESTFTEAFESVSNSDATQIDGMLKSGSLSFSGMFDPLP